MTKQPLENVPQERAVLGALIANTQAVWVHKERLRPDLFVHSLHQRIIVEIHKLVEANREITLPAIVGRLPAGSEDFSPEGYLATLVADEAEPEHLGENIADLEEMMARRGMMRFGQELITQATADSELDSMGRLEAAQEKIGSIHDAQASSVRRIWDIADGVLAEVQEAAVNETVVGIDIGLKAVQDLLGQLMPSRMVLLAGSSGSGKSALGQQIATYASQNESVLFFQLEMSEDEMVERDLAGRTRIPPDKIERAALNEDELGRLADAHDEMKGLRFFIDAKPSQTVAQMRAKAMRHKRLKGLKLIVIDHLLLIRSADKRKGEFDGLRANLQDLKSMAKSLGVAVLVLTQLKGSYSEGDWRSVRRPAISDIFGGSSNEHDPDAILFVYREEYLLERKRPADNDKSKADYDARLAEVEGKVEFILAKRRGGKGYGIRTAYFEAEAVRFSDTPPRGSASRASQKAFELDELRHF